MELKKITKDPDRLFFNWYFENSDANDIYPPLLANINKKYYQLNKCNLIVNEYLYLGELNYLDALNISINQKKSVNVVEISNILYMTDSLNISIKEVDFFYNNNLEGKTLLDALRKVRVYSYEVKKYIISKKLSYKFIILISRYIDKIGKILEQYIKEFSPTISDFRKCLYLLIDYKDYIDLNNYNFDEISKVVQKKNKQYYLFYDKYNEIKKSLSPLRVENLDNFETSQLSFSFAISNYIDYKNILKKLCESKESVNEFYNFLKKNDIY